jgi:hypothetical protein
MQRIIGISLCFLVALVFGTFLLRLYLETHPGVLKNSFRNSRKYAESLLVICSKNPLETFLEKNWRTLAFIGVLLLAVFVWPTLYKMEIAGSNNSTLVRQNRITGKIEKKYLNGGGWVNSE